MKSKASRSWSITPNNLVNRTGAYRLTFPLGVTRSGVYNAWNNETGATYRLVRPSRQHVHAEAGVDVLDLRGHLDRPVTHAYSRWLGENGFPTELSPAQLQARLRNEGVDFAAARGRQQASDSGRARHHHEGADPDDPAPVPVLLLGPGVDRAEDGCDHGRAHSDGGSQGEARPLEPARSGARPHQVRVDSQRREGCGRGRQGRGRTAGGGGPVPLHGRRGVIGDGRAGARTRRASSTWSRCGRPGQSDCSGAP